MKIYEELVERGLIAQVTNEEEIREMVNNGKATFYIGFDCTADSLHVGHFMALCLMKRLQMAGNKPIALIGDGTTLIGDPSGRSDMRQMLDEAAIKHNAECFKRQMEKFIDFSDDKALMLYNSEWLKPLNYIELLREVGACFSVNNMLRAECYKQRMEKGLSFLEFNYMIMQSYDWYYMFQHYGCNMQFGGNDQWSNMLGGTELIRRKLGKDAHAMTITLLLNSEGKKMGKTANGAVWLDPNKTSPFEFYQYWRNVDDADVLKCIRMLTFLPLEQIDEMDKWEGSQLNQAKEILAYELTALGLGEQLDGIYISSDYGCRKPDERFLGALLDDQRLDPQKCLMIGNDLDTDIAGAKRMDLATLYLHTNITPGSQRPAKPGLTFGTPGIRHWEQEGSGLSSLLDHLPIRRS